MAWNDTIESSQIKELGALISFTGDIKGYDERKNEKIFFGCGCFILLALKTPFTYSHWERSNAHPKSQKFFIPSLGPMSRFSAS